MPPSNNSTEAIQRISLKNREYAYIEDANRGVVLVEIGPDAHSTHGLDNVEIGVGIARKGWLERGDVLNARGADDVLAFARARRERA